MSVAAIDVGLKRIGAAICQHMGVITPLDAVLRRNRNQAAQDVDKLLNEYNIKTLVVGIPENEETARRIKHFVSLLAFSGEVVFVDEDFSSYEAKERMRGTIKQKRDGRIDSLAAMIILERYYRSTG
ncbi:MAG: Holliday junction resolvase RuvX [Campylobacteraceae bacterium]|jgi:putative Holliday junction resolvase|nr:Holliday junction resolvase RuvX [Campylobacteraceae bacterium]